jgi:DNA-binding transcriptional ArsR family regulator
MKKLTLDTCPPTSLLSERPLLDRQQAVSLEKTFKMLANATRLRILHSLAIEGEMCVSDLAKCLGMNVTAVSNQLQRMTDRGVVTSRRKGLHIIYRILDPCAISVINHAWCLTTCSETRQLFDNESILAEKHATKEII